MSVRRWLPVLGAVVITLLVLQTGDAWARAAAGGSRGSRSSSAPVKSAPASPSNPTSPGRSYATPSPAAAQPMARPSFMNRWGGMLGGLLVGGLLGGLLFGGLGGGFGIGLMDILLLGGLAFLMISFLRRRRAPEPAYSLPGGGSMSAEAEPIDREPTERSGWGTATATAVAEPEALAPEADLERGIEHIRSMDSRFDPVVFASDAKRAFVQLQQAVMARDVAWLRDRLTAEMVSVLQGQCDRLRSARQTNRLERVDVRGAEVTEAWQEGGRDYVTVCINASLLDYTVDDRTGATLEGSRSVPQAIEEYWTFTRSVGPNPWKLSAIQSG
jgi:predicted lipid-binding transport protein (Tim44 family)